MTKLEITETSPWASANKRTIDLEAIEYPSLEGMEVMLIMPNDFYRKKLMGLGPAYIATAMQRCGIKVHTMNCGIWSYDDIEIAKILIESNVKIFGIALSDLHDFYNLHDFCKLVKKYFSSITISVATRIISSYSWRFP